MQMDNNAKKIVQGAGAMAETGLVVLRAATASGATPQEALAVTRAYFEALMSKTQDAKQQREHKEGGVQ